MDPEVAFWLCIAGGLFAIAGAAFNWDWFMQNPKANVFVRLLGRTGARLFYIIVGVGAILLGIWAKFGVPE